MPSAPRSLVSISLPLRHRSIKVSGDEPFHAYKHQVTLRLQAAAEAFTVPCAFRPDLRIDCILGQNGFFDTHKIVFEKYKKRFAITPILQKKK